MGCVAKLQHWAGGPGFRAVHSPPEEKMHDAIRVVILNTVRGANPTDPVPYLALNHNTIPFQLLIDRFYSFSVTTWLTDCCYSCSSSHTRLVPIRLFSAQLTPREKTQQSLSALSRLLQKIIVPFSSALPHTLCESIALLSSHSHASHAG